MIYEIKDLLYFRERGITVIIAIMLSVSAILILNSIGDSMLLQMKNQLNRFGPDIVYIYPGDPSSVFLSGFTNYLDEYDIEILNSVGRVELVCPYFMETAILDGKRVNVQSTTDECYGWFNSRGILLLEKGAMGDVVFGAGMGDILGEDYDIGRSVQLEGKRYRVSGFLGGHGGVSIDDRAVYVTFTTAKKLFGAHYALALIRVSDDPTPVVEILKNRFRNQDVQILTTTQLAERASFILTVVETAVLGVGSISIVVAILITFNSMYSNIMKHTRMVGLLKALGTTNSEALFIFIKQAIVLGVIGGVLGVILSVVMVQFINFFTQRLNTVSNFLALGITISVSPNLAIHSLILAISVSVLGAIIPAIKAAGVAPAVALRYE